MTDYTLIFYIILSIFGILYISIIALYTTGWYRLKSEISYSVSGSTLISIIVPCRNEEKNIEFLLNDLVKQDYPAHYYEIIVVDDNSTDRTKELVKACIKRHSSHRIIFIPIEEENLIGAYKKKAIQLAIEAAIGNLIITTDADCRMKDQWLKTFAGFYESAKQKMIVGPVCFQNEVSFFEKMQTVEFLSLIGITAGAISIGRPIMCNGANLAYEKSAFHDVGGFGNDGFSSGDDVFLLLKIKKRFGNKSVSFIKNDNAFVFTEAKKNLRDFFHQRTRWASKNKGYNFKILTVSFTVFMMNFLPVVGLLWGIFNFGLLKVILMIYLLKLITELPILLGVLSFSHRSRMFIYAIPLALLYPLYIITTGTLGIVASYQWKGRTVRR